MQRGAEPRDGLFIRWGRRLRRFGGVALPVAEEIYGPSRQHTRAEVEQRQQLERPTTPPTDPPD